MSRRRSTVHDAAALRLHPNGVRVPLLSGAVVNPKSSVVTAKTKRPWRDVRGNWMATDAAGEARVPKRRKLSVVDDEGDEGEVDVEVQAAKVYKDARANRRVAFENDWTFIADTESSSVPPDFLKTIHYFAGQYYAARGELFDSAAQYRMEKKEKRRLRVLQAQDTTTDANKDVNKNATEIEDGHADDSDAERPAKVKPRAQKTRTKTEKTQRDMYKAFDGSALICIGMLLQSHISSALADPAQIGSDVCAHYPDASHTEDHDEAAGSSDAG